MMNRRARLTLTILLPATVLALMATVAGAAGDTPYLGPLTQDDVETETVSIDIEGMT